jgi:predicted Fe-Mo cluster-binding NifX family protein
MKIAFPVDNDQGFEATLALHFGRAPMYAIYNTETKAIESIPNTGEHFGGRFATPKLLQQNEVELLICRSLGRRAVTMFNDLNIQVCLTQATKVKEALDAYNNDELESATADTACAGRGHGHKH